MHRTDEYQKFNVRITPAAPSQLRKVFYTVPSRLRHHHIQVRLFEHRLELWLGETHLLDLVRGRPDASGRHARVVDYRHVIHSLRRKPMAPAEPGSTATSCFHVSPTATRSMRCCRPSRRARPVAPSFRSWPSPMSAMRG